LKEVFANVDLYHSGDEEVIVICPLDPVRREG